jgi:aldehyde:ferredoxin oxidoreductase
MYLGARGINSRLLINEIPVGTDALGPDNVLYFGTGPMEGLPVGNGRMSVACKSPRSTVAEGSFGGHFGPELRRAGIDYLAIRGQSKAPVYLFHHNGEVDFKCPAPVGSKTDETDAVPAPELADPNVQLRYIGPRPKAIVHQRIRNQQQRQRAGCGSDGSKQLALAMRGHRNIQVADYDSLTLPAARAF